MQPGLGVVCVKVKSAKGSSFQVVLKCVLWKGENGRKLKKLIPLNQRSLGETHRGSTIVRAAVHLDWGPIPARTLSSSVRSAMDVLTFKRHIHQSVVRLGTEGKGFTSLVLSNNILPAQCKLQRIWSYDLKLFWHILWCFRNEWDAASVFGLVGTLSTMWPQAFTKLIRILNIRLLLNIAEVGQQYLQVTGERRGVCACLCWYVQTSGVNT